ncbi:adhesin-like protein [methanogenic archaeon ISO4-H5]|nr:adhesin-like protein [methanogenic archaeon ISO4-H5]
MRGRTIAVLSVLLAIFMLTVSAPLSSATGEPSFTSASYDPASGKVSFAGTFDSDVSVSVHANGYYSGETVFQLNNGGFSGEIAVGKLARGVYRIIAMSVDDPTDYIVGDFRVDGYLFLDSAEYSYDSGKVTVTGWASDEDLELTIRDMSDNVLVDGAPIKCGDDRRFSASVSPGTTLTSDLRVSVALAGETSVHKDATVQVRRVTTDSDSTVTMIQGESETVHLNVIGCTYADLQIYPENAEIATIKFSTETGNLTITGKAVGETKVTASVGDSVVEFSVTVNEIPPHDSEYTFTLRMEYDYDKADYGTSGLTASDLRRGITLTAVGTNAGEALETALNEAKIPCQFWSKEDGSIKYWVDGIFGLGDVKMEGGLWKYWIQYQIVDGNEAYNQWSLGFYTDGGEFHLLYGITEESGQALHPDEEEPEIPEQFDNSGSQTTIEVKENDDGSTTVIADSTSVIDGTQTVSEITTKENEDGTTTITENTTVTNPDGSSSTTSSVTTVDANGSKTTESTSTNSDGTSSETVSTVEQTANGTVTTSTETSKDASGNTVQTTETVTTVEQTANGTVTTSTETSKDASGNTVQTTETVTTVTDATVDGVRTTETQTESTVTDSSGNTTTVSVSETAVKQADGSSTVVRTTETTSDGKTVTEVSAGSISADGKVHTTAVSTDSEIITSVKADGEDGSYVVSDGSVQAALQQQAAVADAVGAEKDRVIEITSDTSDVSASVGKESLSDMAEENASLRMVSTQGTMTFGKDALSSLSDKDDVTLSFAIADRSSMTSAQREVIEVGSTVVNLTATSAGQSIGKDLGGKVIVTVKHAATDGKTPVAYYVDENGNRTKVAEQSYDAEKGEMTMVLDHFSLYTIVDEDLSSDALPYAVLFTLGLIVILCLCIMVPYARKGQ